MVAAENVARMRVAFAQSFESYARIGGSFSFDGMPLWWGFSKGGLTLISREACFLIAPWPRGRWWTWRAVNKLTVITSYHPSIFSDELPPQMCAYEDLPGDVTSQGYWPFRPEEGVRFYVVSRRCLRRVRYDWWGQLTLATNESLARISTRPFFRDRLTTILESFDWPTLE